MKNLTELLKGALEGVILQIISSKETYGYEITEYLIHMGFEDIVEGTVYTILLRLQKKGMVDVEKKDSELGPPRKFYRINQAGREYLETFWLKWEFLSDKLEIIRKENEDEKTY